MSDSARSDDSQSMTVDDVIQAINRLAGENDLAPLQIGPVASLAEIQAVETGLNIRLPAELRDFYQKIGKIDAWDTANTVSVKNLRSEAESMTKTLLQHKRLVKHPAIERLRSGAKALIVGVTDHGSVGYTFIVVDSEGRTATEFWFFWRDEYVLENAGGSFVEWIDNLLGFAIRAAIESRD